MKKALLLSIAILILSCQQNKKESTIKETKEFSKKIENFDWLIGDWEEVNEKDGKRTFEKWHKISDTEYAGIDFVMQNEDTLRLEKIQLIHTNGKWNMNIKVPEEKEAIVFKMIHHSESEFTCESTEVDFPSIIKFWKSGDRINASVSNAEMETPFEFKKVKS